jgi:hypothetical protein
MMPMHKARARLRWRGAETVREIAKRATRGERALVLLAPGFHHALCVRSGAAAAAHGVVDVTLDAEAFARLARIRGLRDLEKLREPLERGSLSVHLRTPPPQLLFVPLAKPRRRTLHQHHHWNRTAALAA